MRERRGGGAAALRQPIRLEAVDGAELFVCWLGLDCGKQALPSLCERPMTLTGQ